MNAAAGGCCKNLGTQKVYLALHGQEPKQISPRRGGAIKTQRRETGDDSKISTIVPHTSSILLFCFGSPRSKRSVSLLLTNCGQLSRGRSENSLAHWCNPPWQNGNRTKQTTAETNTGTKKPRHTYNGKKQKKSWLYTKKGKRQGDSFLFLFSTMNYVATTPRYMYRAVHVPLDAILATKVTITARDPNRPHAPPSPPQEIVAPPSPRTPRPPCRSASP